MRHSLLSQITGKCKNPFRSKWSRSPNLLLVLPLTENIKRFHKADVYGRVGPRGQAETSIILRTLTGTWSPSHRVNNADTRQHNTTQHNTLTVGSASCNSLCPLYSSMHLAMIVSTYSLLVEMSRYWPAHNAKRSASLYSTKKEIREGETTRGVIVGN